MYDLQPHGLNTMLGSLQDTGSNSLWMRMLIVFISCFLGEFKLGRAPLLFLVFDRLLFRGLSLGMCIPAYRAQAHAWQ